MEFELVKEDDGSVNIMLGGYYIAFIDNDGLHVTSHSQHILRKHGIATNPNRTSIKVYFAEKEL